MGTAPAQTLQAELHQPCRSERPFSPLAAASPAYRGARWLSTVSALCLSGCWAPPTANLRADAEPATFGEPLQVETFTRSTRVEAVGCDARTVTLSPHNAPLGTYAIGPNARNWRGLRIGDQIDARVKIELTVYIPPATRHNLDRNMTNHPPDARVLAVDPSYRLLTLQYADRTAGIFKVSMHTQLRGITPGSWVSIRPIEVLKLHARRHLEKDTGACPPDGAATSP
jgi:hypothetical protein